MVQSRRSVGARELKTRLGRYLRLVQDGLHIVVTERGCPIAEISPLPHSARGTDAGLDALAARGDLTRAEIDAMPDFEPDRVRGGLISDTVVEERGDRF